jgi:hypothetical protein
MLLWVVAAQYIMAEACGKGDCSPHGGQGQKERKVFQPQYSFKVITLMI